MIFLTFFYLVWMCVIGIWISFNKIWLTPYSWGRPLQFFKNRSKTRMEMKSEMELVETLQSPRIFEVSASSLPKVPNSSLNDSPSLLYLLTSVHIYSHYPNWIPPFSFICHYHQVSILLISWIFPILASLPMCADPLFPIPLLVVHNLVLAVCQSVCVCVCGACLMLM